MSPLVVFSSLKYGSHGDPVSSFFHGACCWETIYCPAFTKFFFFSPFSFSRSRAIPRWRSLSLSRTYLAFYLPLFCFSELYCCSLLSAEVLLLLLFLNLLLRTVSRELSADSGDNEEEGP